MNKQTPRRLPSWGWALAVFVFFPSGLFIACGYARLLAWRWAVILAALSGLCMIGFVMLMGHLDHINLNPFARVGVNLGVVLVFAGWIYLVYRSGQRADYWSSDVQRGWRWAKRLLVGLVVFHATVLILIFVLFIRMRIQ